MKNYFAEIMKLVTRPDLRSSSAINQAMHKSLQTVSCFDAQAHMDDKLVYHRIKGSYGWWNDEICPIDELYAYRQKALEDNDHMSVMIFTCIVAAREVNVETQHK